MSLTVSIENNQWRNYSTSSVVTIAEESKQQKMRD